MNSRKEAWLMWAGGVLSGVVIAGVLSQIVLPDNFFAWLKTYQTILAGCLALTGALITVLFISKQIGLSDAHHQEMIKRNLVAARSVLPMVLSELFNYAEDCLTISINMAERRDLSKDFKRPSEKILEVFKEAIKYAPEARQAEMSDLLIHLQIQISRLSDEISQYEPLSRAERMYGPNAGNPVGDNNFQAFDNIFDAEELRRRTENLFYFARGNEDDKEEKSRLEHFQTALFFQAVVVEQWPNLLKVAERRFSKKENNKIASSLPLTE